MLTRLGCSVARSENNNTKYPPTSGLLPNGSCDLLYSLPSTGTYLGLSLLHFTATTYKEVRFIINLTTNYYNLPPGNLFIDLPPLQESRDPFLKSSKSVSDLAFVISFILFHLPASLPTYITSPTPTARILRGAVR